jgi:hypothetical protein
MRVTLVFLAGALCVLLTAGDALGMAWGDSRHRRGNGSNGSSGSFESSGSGYTASVPEPSSLYAIGSALALLGGAGWILRRK